MNAHDDSTIPASTIAAYEETEYWVDIKNQRFALHVEQYSEPLANLIKDNNVKTAAYITAYNPYSEHLDDKDNALRHEELVELVTQREFVYYSGEGKGISNNWPEEKSLLILGISYEDTCALANQLEQYGFIFANADAVPKLVLLH